MRWIALMTTVAMTSVGCAHSQRPESRIYVVSASTEGVGAALGSGGAGGYDCNDEFKKCMKRCWDKRYPWPHNKPQSGWYHERCEQDCNRAFNECEDEKQKEEAERQKKLKFSSMDEAIDWIRSHKADVAIGTVVIVAGVAFVLATGGSGALVLVPLAL